MDTSQGLPIIRFLDPGHPLDGVKRRAAIPMRFRPRTTRAARHMRKELPYLLRYAKLVNVNRGAELRFRHAIAWAREALALRLAAYDESLLADYSEAQPHSIFEYSAEYYCVVAYMNLFSIADQLYYVLRSDKVFEALGSKQLRAQKADVYRILRNVTVQLAGGSVDDRV